MEARGPLFRFGVFEVDPAAGELRKQGMRIRLQDQPFQILVALLERPGDVVTRAELTQRLWPEGITVDFERGLNKAIYRLREALSDDAETPRFIETLPQRGYRFVAPAVRVDQPAAEEPVVEEPPRQPSIPTRWGRRGWVALGGGLAVASLAVVPVRRWLKSSAPIDSIAVLPLENLSRDPEQEFFSDGMTDELIGQIAQITSLRVISRTSTMRYKKSGRALSDIARELGVEAIVEGTVMKTVQGCVSPHS